MCMFCLPLFPQGWGIGDLLNELMDEFETIQNLGVRGSRVCFTQVTPAAMWRMHVWG